MRPGQRRALLAIGLAFLGTVLRAGTCQGDGGTLRAWGQQGQHDIAVFTDPSPLVAGSVDISVLILDRQTGEPDSNARIVIEIFPASGQPEDGLRHPASKRMAVNKLFQAAEFELRRPGPYSVVVNVDGIEDHARIEFEVDVGSPLSPLSGVWTWILGPLPIIGLYLIHRRLVAVSQRDRPGKRGLAPGPETGI